MSGAGSPIEPAAEEPDTARGGASRFPAFASAFTRDALASTPSMAMLAGLHRARDPETGRELDLDALLDDFSIAAIHRRAAFYRASLDRLERDFPAASLGAQERIDREIIANQCRLQLLDLVRIRSEETNPAVAVESIGTSLFFPVFLDYAPAEDRALDVIARLEGVPRFVDQAIATLGRGPLVHAGEARDENDGNREVVETALEPLFPAGSAGRPRFEAARRGALAAIERLQGFLNDAAHREPPGEWRLGPELYRERMQAYFGEPIEPRALLQDAEASLARVRGEMIGIAEPLHERWFASHHGHRRMTEAAARTNTILREVLGRIGEDRVPRDRFFAAIEADIDRIGSFLDGRPIVSVTRRDNLKVIETPPFLRGIYGVAGLHPAPPLDPSLSSFFYVTPIPADWPDAKAISKLREYNRHKLLLLTIHEALPGHYTQLEYANRVRPEWRRVLRSVYGNNAYVEGWAQYAEEMMLDQGIVDRDDPKIRLTFKKEELRILANVILDIRLHTMSMTEREAINLMVRDTFQERAEAEAKLRRARLSSCQLATYYLGWSGWRRIRRDIEAARGDRFDLQSFHDEVLSYGAIPLASLRQLLLGDA